MATERRQPVIEVMDDHMADVLRSKSGAEKLAIADRMFRAARDLIATSVRSMYPDWSDDQVRAETARRIAGEPARPHTG